MAVDYITKKQLDDALRYSEDSLIAKIKVDQKKYHSEVMDKFDQILGELQSMREDNEVGTYQTRELRETAEDHEKRITKLEAS